MKQHYIGYRMFAALKARNSEEHESRHQAALRAEFEALVPSAGRLQVAELVLERHHTAEGCRLEYFLLLPPQIDLGFGEPPHPDGPGARQLELFRQDVTSITTESKTIKTRLVLATSPALGHDALKGDSQPVIDLKRLRSLLRRGKRTTYVPAPKGGLPIELPSAPAKLPTGIECDVQAVIESLLSDKTVLMNSISWVASMKVPTDPAVDFPARVRASRKSLSDMQVLRLVSRLDTKSAQRLRVKFDFEWAEGKVIDMQIVDVLG